MSNITNKHLKDKKNTGDFTPLAIKTNGNHLLLSMCFGTLTVKKMKKQKPQLFIIESVYVKIEYIMIVNLFDV